MLCDVIVSNDHGTLEVFYTMLEVRPMLGCDIFSGTFRFNLSCSTYCAPISLPDNKKLFQEYNSQALMSDSKKSKVKSK